MNNSMRFALSPYCAISVAVFAIMFAGIIWYVFVRPVPERTGYGLVTGRSFHASKVVEKSIPRTNLSLEHYSHEIKYTLPDRYVLFIHLDQEDKEIRYTAPVLGVNDIEEGQRVKVVYVERGLPLLWKRIYVKEVIPAP